jgi:hypothetical protein
MRHHFYSAAIYLASIGLSKFQLAFPYFMLRDTMDQAEEGESPLSCC